MNSPKLRPILKNKSYFYEDAAHKKPLDGNPVISIIEP